MITVGLVRSFVFPAVPFCRGQGDFEGRALHPTWSLLGRKATLCCLVLLGSPQISFFYCVPYAGIAEVCGQCPCSSGQPVTLPCPVTFALGLDFLEDWLQPLIDLAGQSAGMIKGADSSHCSPASVSVLTGSHASCFPERQQLLSRVFSMGDMLIWFLSCWL